MNRSVRCSRATDPPLCWAVATARVGSVAPPFPETCRDNSIRRGWRQRRADASEPARQGDEPTARRYEFRARRLATVGAIALLLATLSACQRPQPPDPVADLVRALGDTDEHARASAREALVATGASAVPKVIEALLDSNPSVRGAAAQALGEIADPRAVEPLTLALGDVNPWAQRRAALALRGMGLPESAAAGLQPVLSSPRADVRRQATGVLGTLGEAGVPGLRRSLDDEDATVRLIAARELWRMDAANADLALPTVIAALADDYVRSYALHVIARIGEPSEGLGSRADAAVPALLTALGYEDEDDRENARRALTRIGTAAALSALASADAAP